MGPIPPVGLKDKWDKLESGTQSISFIFSALAYLCVFGDTKRDLAEVSDVGGGEGVSDGNVKE